MPTDRATYDTFEAMPQGRHPLDEASIWSKLSFSWTEPLLGLGNKRQLLPDDLWPLRRPHKVAPLTARFAAAYNVNHRGILRTFFSIYAWQFLWLGLLQLFTAVCDLYGPGFVLGHVIAALEAPAFDVVYVFQLVASLFVVSVASAFAKAHMVFLNEVVGLEFSSCLRSMLFEKALKLSADSKKDKTAGDIANLFSIDVVVILDFTLQAHQMWIVPLQVLVVLVLLFRLVGWASLVGFVVVAAIITINAMSALVLGKTDEEMIGRKDDRMKLVNEVFGSIQIVKFNAWEEKFRERIEKLRDLEVDSLRAFYGYVLILMTLSNCTPVLVTLAAFATYTLGMQQVLTVSVVFSTIALVKSLQEAITKLPFSMTGFIQSLVSAKRINEVLLMEQYDPTNVQTPTDMSVAATYGKDKVVVAIEDGSFGWDADNLL
ncbi:hypothetical protein AeNC1_017278, partial [Aphanomyces euteiches]